MVDAPQNISHTFESCPDMVSVFLCLIRYDFVMVYVSLCFSVFHVYLIGVPVCEQL